MTADLVGQTIGKYRVDALLGSGGMGKVYRAEHVELRRPAAIKVMHPHLADDPNFQARFRHEARAAAALNHPNIIQVYDFGDEAGQYYLAMELVPDGSIRALFKHSGQEAAALSIGVDLARQAAEGLSYAHRRGMVHRDVKPDNLLIEKLDAEEHDGHAYRLRVCDFGLIRVAEGSMLTASGITLGTPAYMSPEQCRGVEVDARSDQYSLGVVLYEIATGRKPFETRSIADAAYQHVHVPPTPPRVLRPDLSEELQDIILACLAKQPEQRFGSCAALARALAGLGQVHALSGSLNLTPPPTIREGSPPRAETPPGPAGSISYPPAQTPAATPATPSWPGPAPAAPAGPAYAPPGGTPPTGQAALPPPSRSLRTLTILVGILVLVLSAIAAVRLLSGDGDDDAGFGASRPTSTRTATAALGQQVLDQPTSTSTSTMTPTATATPPATLPPTFSPTPTPQPTDTPTPTVTPTPVPVVPSTGDVVHSETWPDFDGAPTEDGSRLFAQAGARHFVITAGSPGIYQASDFITAADASVSIEVQMLNGGALSEGCLYRLLSTVAEDEWTGLKFCVRGDGTLVAHELFVNHASAVEIPLNGQTVNAAVLNALAIVTRGAEAYFVVNGVLVGVFELDAASEGRIRYATLNSLSADDAEFVFANLTIRAVLP